ncbi:glycosyltransferase involved in cell wall biosynthesis [Arcticibacter tournemirensis]|uniref:Glycosyltransferase family 4 protein n=1 Tax=Arcticibacter tournemirensis TaxID=699437 RepID=A0A5M9HN30_9SPHI|nr:glycosyltransferase family 4 protein [Arcticibacter tournemirensis]KAA8486788.1 glycosyltransferase family 4 protein [Arcticibacter tournemirensis]TQM49331.1 glycosyltransferase involved in cell wall biosynthesis [Arcticibacter tournemirensis]
MKILFLSHNFYPFIGGIEIISEILASTFANAGHEVHVITWTKDSPGEAFPFKVSRNPGILKIFKAHAWADLVFENNPCLRLAWPGIFFSRPSVIALHTWISRSNGKLGVQDRIKFRWLKRAHKVIAVSNALRKSCWPNATVLGNPYRAKEFRILSNISRTKDFVFLGRLVSDKGVDLAIKAIYEFKMGLNNSAASPSLTIVGDGPERTNLKRLVADLNMEDSVIFTGPLSGSELVKCLNQHRYLLVPSIWEEPFGVVVLEGIACGCIPIVSDGGGLPDAVGKAGITFRRGDVDDLIACIRNIYNNTKLEKELLDFAASHLGVFHPDTIGRQYLDEIEGTLKTK